MNFEALKFLGNSTKTKIIIIDNGFFKSNYKITAVVFAVISVLVTSSQIFGNPIHCTDGGLSGPSKPLLDAFCWNKMYIITNPKLVAGYNPYSEVLTPLMDKHVVKYLSFYPWLPVLLTLHCLLHYIPHWIWKQLENGTVKWALCTGLKDDEILDWIKKRSAIVRKTNQKIGSLKSYGYAFIICEILNFFFSIISIILMEYYLQQKNYGFHRLGLMEPEGVLSTDRTTFPDLAKCNLYKIGVGGNTEPVDSLCVVSHGPYYDKIFLALWFLLVIQICLNTFNLLFRLMSLTIPNYFANQLHNMATSCNNETIKQVIDGHSFGEFLFLYFLGKSMKPGEFSDIMSHLNNKFNA